MTDLRSFLHAAEARSFRYGRHDCCTVAAAWIMLCGGPDVLHGRRYTSLRDGLERAAAEGHDDHLPWLEEACARIPVLMARAGDLVVYLQARLPAVGIVRPGGEDALYIGPSGARIAAITDADYCLRVR